MTIRPIIAVLTIAGTTFALTACEPLENALSVMNNGEPMPGGPSSSAMSLSQTVEPVAVVAEPEPPCHVPASHFRTHWCNPDTGKFELIP